MFHFPSFSENCVHGSCLFCMPVNLCSPTVKFTISCAEGLHHWKNRKGKEKKINRAKVLIGELTACGMEDISFIKKRGPPSLTYSFHCLSYRQVSKTCQPLFCKSHKIWKGHGGGKSHLYVVSQITKHNRINCEGVTDNQFCILGAVTLVFNNSYVLQDKGLENISPYLCTLQKKHCIPNKASIVILGL